jgi:hypothetical protein
MPQRKQKREPKLETWPIPGFQNTVTNQTVTTSGSLTKHNTKERRPDEFSSGLFHKIFLPKIKMDFYTNNSDSNAKHLINFLRENNLETSFNSNPDRFISRSLTQTKISKYISCPSCYFKKTNLDAEQNNNVMLSSSIHLIADYLIRNQEKFPRSREVLDFINFSDANLLEQLKIDPENKNYDILRYLSEVSHGDQIKILKGSLYVYGTAKRLGFEEVRKKDEISLNLHNKKSKSEMTLYTKPDYTGRHLTTTKKSGRKFDNFLIDYKLNFNERTESNAIQMSFYYLTHLLSNRNIHHYYVMNLSNGNLFELSKINLSILIAMLDKFLILKSLNYRGENKNHNHIKEESLQKTFLDVITETDFGNSLGSNTYDELNQLLTELENSINFTSLGQIVTESDINTIFTKYPIKFD